MRTIAKQGNSGAGIICLPGALSAVTFSRGSGKTMINMGGDFEKGLAQIKSIAELPAKP